MNDMELFIAKMSETMTVKQVAESLGIPERTVHNSIDRVLPGLKQNGKPTYLDPEMVAMVSKDLKKAHNSELASSGKVAETDIEMIEKARDVMAWMNRKMAELQARNSELEPKAAFFDQVADSKTALQMRDVAAALNISGIGRNKIFSILRDQGILDSRNIPYRQYQDSGYFRVIEQSYTDPMGETHVSLKTLVYQKGVDYIKKTIEKARKV